MLSDKCKTKDKLDYYKWLFLKRPTAMKIARHRVLSKSERNKYFAWLTTCVVFVCLNLF